MRVLDDGPGVPEADRELIFRRFWRRDRAKADSRGLGLAIVARVAEAHDGSVTVDEPAGRRLDLHAEAAARGQLDRRKLTVAICQSKSPQKSTNERRAVGARGRG